MLKHQLGLGVSFALLLALFAGPSVAQQAPPAPEAAPAIQCGGQYECVEDRPMTPAGRTSYNADCGRCSGIRTRHPAPSRS